MTSSGRVTAINAAPGVTHNETPVSRIALAVALVAALMTIAVGSRWNTAAVGGTDSYCYAGQARMLADGQFSLPAQLDMPVPWPNAPATFAPSGFAPVPGPSGASVPLCPAGLSLLMAAALRIGGVPAMFMVVPWLGALAVWCTFVIGRRLAGPVVGAASAALIACSPVFLHQLVQPASDVPAAAFWTASLAVALVAGDRPRREDYALCAGLLAGAAVMVRPHLAPLAILPVLLALPSRTAAIATIGGVVPAVAAVAWLQAEMYGSPLRSGYGDPGSVFGFSHVLPNLMRYPAWLAAVHTPVMALAVLAPLVTRDRRQSWILLGFAVAVLAVSLPYGVFDDWSSARFLLPAIPLLVVLTVVVVSHAARRLPSLAQAAAVLLVAAALGGFWVSRASDLGVFRLKSIERKYVELGRYAAGALPPNAVVLATRPTGPVRFYAGLPTLSWDAIDPAWLDRVIEELRRRDYVPYFVLESRELDTFTSRFRGHSALAALDWPARASIGRAILVYDPADRTRHLAGEQIPSERIDWPAR